VPEAEADERENDGKNNIGRCTGSQERPQTYQHDMDRGWRTCGSLFHRVASTATQASVIAALSLLEVVLDDGAHFRLNMDEAEREHSQDEGGQQCQQRKVPARPAAHLRSCFIGVQMIQRMCHDSSR
jgi:hypothetical protein